MTSFIGKRALASGISLIGLVILVFFLSRLTGDPTNLYLPLDASLELAHPVAHLREARKAGAGAAG